MKEEIPINHLGLSYQKTNNADRILNIRTTKDIGEVLWWMLLMNIFFSLFLGARWWLYRLDRMGSFVANSNCLGLLWCWRYYSYAQITRMDVLKNRGV